MRPRTIAEFVGQEHLIGEGGALRRQVERGYLASMILWGPPGSGKTTLARLLSAETGAHFSTLSAVLGGVADVRRLIAEARERSESGGPQTVLFIDEIHRFNKAQQDALLPHVEEGTVTFIGATTKIVDRDTGAVHLGRVPAYSVVVPGSLPGKPLPDGSPGPNLYCAVIVKKVDEQTRAKTSINELLRE